MTKRLEPIEEMKAFMRLKPSLPPKAWRAWFAELTPEQREEVEAYLADTLHHVAEVIGLIDWTEINASFENFGQAIADGVASGVTNDPTD